MKRHTAVCYFFFFSGGILIESMERNGEPIFQEGDCIEQRYRIIRPIGEGGMGCVYLAEDLRLGGQRWAVKWIPRDEFDPDQPMKEAKMMIDLQHPSLPRIVDFIPMNELGGCCLVMDYLAGETLLDRSASCGHTLPWQTVVGYAVQLCDLLHYLHSLDSPIVFRDVKPSNVIVSPDGYVKLVDFGIARTYKEGNTSDTVHVGSVGFAAPELLANRQTDQRADLYSLGCLIYFLLCGGQYYNFTKIPLDKAAEDIPAELAAAVGTLLCDDPGDRYENAMAAKQALIEVLGAGSPEPQDSSGHRQHSGFTLSAVGAERKIVAVCGLFPGAGTTFVSVALAKFLADKRVRVAYVECPWQEGDSLLAMRSESQGTGSRWQEGALSWNLASEIYEPERNAYDAESLYKLFFKTKADVYIVDVSSDADERAAEAIIGLADEVVAVVAPDPSLLRRPKTLKNWERINGKGPSGRIRWVANRVPGTARIPDFYRLFSQKPDCIVAEFPYDVIVSAKWKGRWSQEDNAVRPSLEHALLPLLESIAPVIHEERGIRASAKKWLANSWKTDYNKHKS
ncbi:serine/threonine protein kinase [Paenibacillus alkalitolerans]|uniref:serine/threonine protein kinase n=1 Tax=Paenibacillus alkalitolerans TaxID=2799335 RepID=UPI0018F51EA8|nr:serine/threonine-protein kinase [Paenibacillus alkalitolerans]